MLSLKNRIIVALDVDQEAEAMKLAEQLGPEAGALKVGPRLTNRYGPDLIKKLSQISPVFLDHKYYDIPSTMEGAVRSGFDMGATIVTIHASSGSTALSRMATVERELNQIRPFQILAVTVLMSFKVDEQPRFYTSNIDQQVSTLAEMAYHAGIKGIVCSPHEIKSIRSKFFDAVIVTPGVRSEKVEGEDQARVMNASEAVLSGANYLVVGRPILQSKDSLSSLRKYIKEADL